LLARTTSIERRIEVTPAAERRAVALVRWIFGDFPIAITACRF
jgi:hypothetical protein